MKVFWLQIAGLLIVIFGALLITSHRDLIKGLPGSSSPTPLTGFQKITLIDGQSSAPKVEINVEIVESKEARSMGLGERDSLASDSGMLFVFDHKDKYNFWMKGMRIPLDFIWIDGDKVVDLLSNVPPPTPGQSDDTLPLVAPVAKVDKVLEVNANFIGDKGILVGDRIQLKGS